MKNSTVMLLASAGLATNFSAFLLSLLTHRMWITVMAMLGLAVSWNILMIIAKQIDAGESK